MSKYNESGNSYDYVDYGRGDIESCKPLFSLIDDEAHEYNPFSDPTSAKIGSTLYKIKVSCQGKEPILEKIRRILFDDSLSDRTRKEGKT